MAFNYQKICEELLKDLPKRTRDVLERRFGLKTGKKETLESIGRSYGITRERVRQIESDGLKRIKQKLKKRQRVYQYFKDFLNEFGKLKREDILLFLLGKEQFSRHVYFLLNLSDEFERYSENQDFYTFWTTDPKAINVAKRIVEDFYTQLKKEERPLDLSEYSPPFSISRKAIHSYLEASKLIDQGPEGKFGLRDWPEINPRGIKDKAYLVFKREQKPLHFAQVAQLIGPEALVQTVHNELIRDGRFILIGRGIYALSEWGYKPGTVKDIIAEVLKQSQRPLSKEEIINEVLKQRLVKKNTILLNLSNKKYFSQTEDGKYILRNGRDIA